MPMKYVIAKMKGAFYAGSEKIAEKGLKIRRYVSLRGVKDMVKALHLSASSLIFRGVSKGEQKKITGAKAGLKLSKSKPKSARKTKAKGRRKR